MPVIAESSARTELTEAVSARKLQPRGGTATKMPSVHNGQGAFLDQILIWPHRISENWIKKEEKENERK
jgi:hypothetical protein